MKIKKLLLAVILCLFVVTLTACGGDEKNKYTVTFNSNGGSAVESVTVEEGKTVAAPASPIRDMYDFAGWFTDLECTSEYDFSIGVTSNITLYAKWNAVDPASIYTITYELDGGQLPTSAPKQFTNCQTVVLPTPTKTDYTFDGWYEGENKVESLTENRNYTLVAKWSDKVILLVESVSLNKNLAAFGNKDKTFVVDDESYLVGDDNNWVFEPVLSLIKYDTETGRDWVVAQSKVTVKYQIEIRELTVGSNDELVVGDLLTYYEEPTDTLKNDSRIDSVDLYKCTIDFGTAAIGQKFRVSVLPLVTTADKDKPVQPVSFDIEVVDGWNVYSALDLAYIENRTYANDVTVSAGKTINDVALEDKYAYYLKDVAGSAAYDDLTAWQVFKAEKVASGELIEGNCPSNFVFHTNITVGKNDIPSYFFWTREELDYVYTDYTEAQKTRATGSLRDYSMIYTRILKAGETMNIYGNYFTLNTSNMPLVTMPFNKLVDETTTINSHATLFRFEGTTTSKVNVETIKLLGNAKISNEVKYSGGLIQLKDFGVDVRMYNNVSLCYYITYMYDCNRNEAYANVPFLIDSCYATDSYNCFVYNWGTSQMKIVNSTMLNAGGPAIIQDHVIRDLDDDDTWDQDEPSWPSYTEIIDSDIQSWVAGTEGWFMSFNATEAATQLKNLEAGLFNKVGRSFLQTQTKNGQVIVDANNNPIKFFNLICVNKSGQKEGLTATLVKGGITFGKTDTTTSSLVKNFPFGYDGNPFGTDEATDHSFYEFYEDNLANYIVQTVYKDTNGNDQTSYLAINSSFATAGAGSSAYTPNDFNTTELQQQVASTIDQSKFSSTEAYMAAVTEAVTAAVTEAYTNAIMADLAKGDYVCVYYGGMSIVFGYYDYAA